MSKPGDEHFKFTAKQATSPGKGNGFHTSPIFLIMQTKQGNNGRNLIFNFVLSYMLLLVKTWIRRVHLLIL